MTTRKRPTGGDAIHRIAMAWSQQQPESDDKPDVGAYLANAIQCRPQGGPQEWAQMAFAQMLEETFLTKFSDPEITAFKRSLDGLVRLAAIKGPGIDALDHVLASKLPWRISAILFSVDGKTRYRIALNLVSYFGRHLDDREELSADELTERLALLRDSVTRTIDLIQRLDQRADLFEVGEIPLFGEQPRDASRLSAIEFFEKYWAWRVLAGEIYADDLRDRDLKLYNALAQHQSRQGARLNDLIPPSITRGRLKHVTTREQQRMHKRELAAERQRRHRNRLRAKRLDPG